MGCGITCPVLCINGQSYRGDDIPSKLSCDGLVGISKGDQWVGCGFNVTGPTHKAITGVGCGSEGDLLAVDVGIGVGVADHRTARTCQGGDGETVFFEGDEQG